MKVLIVGLGEIGTANCEYIRQLGNTDLQVFGIDTDKHKQDHAVKQGLVDGIADSYNGFDVIVVCVPTADPKDVNKPYLKAIQEVTLKLLKEASPETLVCIESTVKAGTCEQIAKMLQARHIHLVHFPERFWKNDKQQYGVNQRRVLGYANECCLTKALDYYLFSLSIPPVPVKLVSAEIIKQVENLIRYCNIALAESIKMLCDFNGWDFDEIRDGINTKKKPNANDTILEAKNGIGRHCLTKDSLMVGELFDEIPELRSINPAIFHRAIDLAYRKHIELIAK